MILQEISSDAEFTRRAILASLRHELRTPLNAIIGYSEMLMEDIEASEDKNFLADIVKIHSAGKQLLSIVNDILDTKKIESGQMTLEPEAVGAMLRVELLTPLNAIIGFSEMLMEEAENDEVLLSDIKKIDIAAKCFLTLLNDVVNFQKIRAGTAMSETQTKDSCLIRQTLKTIHASESNSAKKMGNRSF